MKRKQQLLCYSVSALVGFALLCSLASVGTTSANLAKGTEKAYTVTLNSANQVSNANTVQINSSYSLSVFSGAFTSTSGEFGTLASGGYFGSSTPLYGISSFAVKLTSGSLFAYFGHSAWGREQVFADGYFTVGTLSSVTPGPDAAYFYLAPGSSGAVINEIQITYSCLATSYTADSNDLLDGVSIPENPGQANTSVTLSNAVTNNSHRSFHLENSIYGSGGWPSVLLTLKNPITVAEGGRFTFDADLVSGKNSLIIALYDANWALYQSAASSKGEYGTNIDGYNAGSGWHSIKTYSTIQPSCPGTYNASTNPYKSSFSVSYIRLTFDTGDASAVTSLYLDNMIYDNSGETTLASLWNAYNSENPLQNLDYSTSANGSLTSRGSSLSFAGIKGGTDASQLMITPTRDISAYTFSAPSLSDGAGNTIPASAISTYAEKYVSIDSSSNETTMAAGNYPDALVPLSSLISAKENTITSGANQGLWISLAIPSSQAAGTYTGNGTLTLNSATFSVPFSVQVYGVTMPSVVHLKSCYLMWYDQIVNYYGESASTTALRKSYYDFLVAHRAMPDGLPDIYEGDAASGYAGFADNFAALIAGNDAINSYRLTFSKNSDGTLNTTDAQNQLNALISKNIALWAAGTHVNFFDKLYYYIDDEPTSASYATVASNSRAIKTLKTSLSSQLDSYPTLKASFLAMNDIVTMAYPSGTDSTSIKNRTALGVSTSSNLGSYYYNEAASYNDGINTWCPLYNNFDSADNRSLYATRQANGEHVWWYGCIIPVQPYPTYHTNASLLTPRLLSWMAQDYGIEGNLYWCANYFSYYNGSTSAIRDVWANGKTWENCYGDGMLVYPGNKYGISGPISTLRLENIMASEEDYECLYLFKNYIDTYNSTYSKSVSASTLLSSYYTQLFNGVQSSCTAATFVSVRNALLATLEKMGTDLKGTVESLS